MGHDHSNDRAVKSIGLAFFLNAGFTVFEIIGGILTNSVAILSDAVHDAGDAVSLGINWGLQRLSTRRGNSHFTYGYRRFSILGALITSFLLIGGLIFILTRAIGRLQNPEHVSGPGMTGIAVVGIVVNGIAALRLRKGRSLPERAASWHMLEDVLGWAAVLVAGLVLIRWDVPVIDPILSIVISLFVMWNVLRLQKRIWSVFLQRSPDNFSVSDFERKVGQTPAVEGIHHTHVWTLDGERHVLTTHVQMAAEATRVQILNVKSRIRQMLDSDKFEHVTVDVEIKGEPCVSAES